MHLKTSCMANQCRFKYGVWKGLHEKTTWRQENGASLGSNDSADVDEIVKRRPDNITAKAQGRVSPRCRWSQPSTLLIQLPRSFAISNLWAVTLQLYLTSFFFFYLYLYKLTDFLFLFASRQIRLRHSVCVSIFASDLTNVDLSSRLVLSLWFTLSFCPVGWFYVIVVVPHYIFCCQFLLITSPGQQKINKQCKHLWPTQVSLLPFNSFMI